MDATALQAGNLLDWVESLDADERAEYAPPNMARAGLRAVHVRVGLSDIMVKPVGQDQDGAMLYGADIHTHITLDDSIDCYRYNREANERRTRESAIDPERAAQRAEAEHMGMPMDMIDRLLPIGEPTGRRELPTVESPVPAGPAGFYL